MLAWRLCRERYADLNGIGAAKVGGRWNPAGIPMVYMSSTDALAALEVQVHFPGYIPETYVFVTAGSSFKNLGRRLLACLRESYLQAAIS